MVVSYTIPMLVAELLEQVYRVVDYPDVMTDFSTPEGYERMRRALMVVNANTIFGPVSFNKFQRNVGRGAAGTQWLPSFTSLNNETSTNNNKEEYFNALIYPFLQAESDTVLPAESAILCDAGEFVNQSLFLDDDSLLTSKCSPCPINTFTPDLIETT